MIGVIGCGKVGFAHLQWLAAKGIDAVGYDPNEEVQRRIARELGEAARLTEFVQLHRCEAVHICVPTESAADGSCDLSVFEDVILGLARRPANSELRVVVQRSTCPPGTGERMEARLGGLSYAVNPSFLRKASILEDTFSPERIAYSGSGIARSHLDELYAGMLAARFVDDSHTAIELLKYVENTMDAVLISFWNEMLQYAVKKGLTAASFIRIMERLSDRPKYRTTARVPGKAFGLWCVPKDLRAVISDMSTCSIEGSLLRGALETNASAFTTSGEGILPATTLMDVTSGATIILPAGASQISKHFSPDDQERAEISANPSPLSV